MAVTNVPAWVHLIAADARNTHLVSFAWELVTLVKLWVGELSLIT